MATPNETFEETRLKVLAWLNGTQYAATSLRALDGGQSNFTYHARLLTPLEDGTTDVLVKHSEPYMARHSTNSVTINRCLVEAVCLSELKSAEVQLNGLDSAKYIVRTPKCFRYDHETKTQILEYLPGVVDLKAYMLNHFPSPTPRSLEPQCHNIGKALAEYMVKFHSEARKAFLRRDEEPNIEPFPTLRVGLKYSGDMQALKHMINYDWLLERIDQFPDVLSEARGIFLQVKEEALKELSSELGLTAIHGDFCPQNILLPDKPLDADGETSLFVVDWENAQLGVESLDHGEMIGELYALWLYKRIDAGLWTIRGYAEGLGPQSETFAWRLALQVGVHLLSFGTIAPGWGTHAQAGDVARHGRDIIVNAWHKNREWFEASDLACLFTGVVQPRRHKMAFIVAAIAVAVVYVVVTCIYRLYLSPLAKFPGPKIAALTPWYNGYHDLVNGGQYIWVIEEMHRKYGPIVRTRPDTIHVNDPAFIETLYSQSPKHRRERHHTILQTMQAPGSILATKDHDLHRRRRAVLNPYFSSQNVRRLSPVIDSTLKNLLRRMEGWAKTGEPAAMNRAYRAATKDVIQAYCFGDGERCLDMEDCNAAFFDIITPQRVCHLGTHVYWLAVLMANLPPVIMTTLLPRVGVFATFMIGLNAQIDQIKQAEKLPANKTIFHEILRSDIPDSEKETKRMADEAMVLVIAGSETTASTLCAITYHLLADPSFMARLKAEIEPIMPDPNQLPDPSKLNNLPFMNALIQEAIRLYPGASHRQDRIAPDEDLVYKRPDGTIFTIPAGTGIGMTAPLVNRNPDLYPNPLEFRPDRYLEQPGLAAYQFSFSKGTRQCVGINLAYQELQIFTAGIFRKYSAYDPSKDRQGGPTLELYKTKREDVSIYSDYITFGQYPGSEGLRLIIREE
ncbi:hypothetical protein FDECE_15429 [Fusarium decemcellulare]|nr:hypothetical protein FDECE_15429 [Fusarium decemcellulare]